MEENDDDDEILPENAWGDDSSDDEVARKANNSRTDDDDDDMAYYGAQHILILIDCHSSMFQAYDDKASITPFDAALYAVDYLLKLRIKHVATSKSGKREGVGVLLFGTLPQHQQYSRSSITKISTCYNWMPLEPPGTAQVLHVRKSLPPFSTNNNTNNNRSTSSQQQSQSSLFWYPPTLQSNDDNINKNSKHERERDLQQEFAASCDETSSPKLSTLRAALLQANTIFMNAKCVGVTNSQKQNNTNNTIWIFTNQDDPCHGNEEEKIRVTKIKNDLLQNGIQIKLRALPNYSGSTTSSDCNTENNNHNMNKKLFDYTLFYNRMIRTDDDEEQDEEDTSSASSVFNLHHFLNQIQQQFRKRRPMRGISLLLPGTTTTNENCSPFVLVASLDLYRLVQIQRKPTSQFVANQSNKIAVKETSIFDDSSGAEFIAKQNKDKVIRTYVQFGESRIPFTKEEVERIKQNALGIGYFPCLLLFGFKPASLVSGWYKYQMDRSYFAYPNNVDAPGSIEAFAALHFSMCNNNVVGIGELSTAIGKSCSAPRLVLIIPEPEVRTTNNVQLQPPGFVVIPLPFEDDFRSDVISPKTCSTAASTEVVNTMKQLIVAQQEAAFDDDFCYFTNPSLTQFWNYIEAVALAQPVPYFEDETEMDQNFVIDDTRTLELVKEIKELLPPAVEQDRKKRKTNEKITSNDDGTLDFEVMVKDGTLEKCTNTVLKGFLHSVGHSQTGNKQMLIERIIAHFECPESLLNRRR